MVSARIAILFGIELYGVVADIGAFPDAGMTDPEVGRGLNRTWAGDVWSMAPAPEQAIVVGYGNDIEGAHASGIRCVAVASHHFNVEQLREAGADYAIGSLEEALPL